MRSMTQTAKRQKGAIDMYFIKKRCGRCWTKLRDDGTCPNPNCCRYVKEDMTDTTSTATSTTSTTTASGSDSSTTTTEAVK